MSDDRGVPLALRDAWFLDSDDGLPVRILTEYLESLHCLRLEQVHDGARPEPGLNFR